MPYKISQKIDLLILSIDNRDLLPHTLREYVNKSLSDNFYHKLKKIGKKVWYFFFNF